MKSSDPPESLGTLSALIGRWEGSGRGFYPTIETFTYDEVLEFSNDGRPLLRYLQTTSRSGGGSPMHSETGFWRVVAPGRLEIVLAHTFGIVEVQEGTFGADHIDVASTALVSTGTAKQVASVRRSYRLEGDTLSYGTGMAAAGQVHQPHLEGRLRRVSAR